jgi:hypothetical protein
VRLNIDQGGPLFESPDPTRYGPGGGCFMGSLAPSSASPISFSCFSIAAFAALLLGSILASWRPINRLVLVFGVLVLCITGLRGHAMAAGADADVAGSKHPVYFSAGLGFAHIDEAIHTRYSAANYQLTIANEIYPMLRLGYPLSDNYALELGARWDIYSGSIDRTNTTGSDNLRSYTLRGKKNLLGAVFGNGIASVAFLPPVDRSESRVKLFTVHHF